MGIPSLNSAIFYNISLYFHSNHVNITNIPDPRPRKQPISWTADSFCWSCPPKQSISWTGKEKATANAVARLWGSQKQSSYQNLRQY